jgi:endonuclease YncB( thermonuclease family)
MIRRFLCCFTTKLETDSIRKSVVSLTNKHDKNIEDICVSITDDAKYPNMNEESLLKNNSRIEWKDTIPFVPPIEDGLVIKVYDGDTITIASKLPYQTSPMYRFSVRLSSIDCPEMKSKDENEKICAEIAKQEVTKLVMNKVVTLKNLQTEKYGRILADVYIDDLHVNKHLLDRRLAINYDGGTKKSPKNWMEYYEDGIFS